MSGSAGSTTAAGPSGQTAPGPPCVPLSWQQQPPLFHLFSQANDLGAAALIPRQSPTPTSHQVRPQLATAVLETHRDRAWLREPCAALAGSRRANRCEKRGLKIRRGRAGGGGGGAGGGARG